jgi:hypothetical protein
VQRIGADGYSGSYRWMNTKSARLLAKAHPVRGNIYFLVKYLDRDLRVPLIETYFCVGQDPPDHSWSFQSAASHQSDRQGIHGLPPEDRRSVDVAVRRKLGASAEARPLDAWVGRMRGGCALIASMALGHGLPSGWPISPRGSGRRLGDRALGRSRAWSRSGRATPRRRFFRLVRFVASRRPNRGGGYEVDPRHQ